MTVLFDIPAEDGLQRKRDDDEITRFESHVDLAFHRRVRNGFLALAAAEPGRFLLVDGTKMPDEIETRVTDALVPRLRARLLVQTGTGGIEAGTGNLTDISSEPQRDSLRMNK